MSFRDFLTEFAADPAVKQRRQQEVPVLVNHLVDLGINDPDTVNNVADTYVKTGHFALPTHMSGDVPAEGPPTAAGALPTAHMLGAPVHLGKRVALFNEDTGQYSMPGELQGSNVEAIRYKPSAAARTAEPHYLRMIDPGTGEVVNSIPIKAYQDQRFRLSKHLPKESPGKPADRQKIMILAEKLAKAAVAEEARNQGKLDFEIQGLLRGGVPTETLNRYLPAAEAFYKGDPEGYHQALNAVKAPAAPAGGDYSSPEDIKSAFKAGKLSREQAVKLLKGIGYE